MWTLVSISRSTAVDPQAPPEEGASRDPRKHAWNLRATDREGPGLIKSLAGTHCLGANFLASGKIISGPEANFLRNSAAGFWKFTSSKTKIDTQIGKSNGKTQNFISGAYQCPWEKKQLFCFSNTGFVGKTSVWRKAKNKHWVDELFPVSKLLY